ncbi:Calcineurin responsive transcriptional factor [Mycena venus]|uniref:Calcineurin responsive transcriptional factor n=1 Tax=Mycena venus TaxID=2733690 RepID=A0A8H7CXK4_9AGAR|nr:Calcineurin responsive transcriptional factor [Mycena venus]
MANDNRDILGLYADTAYIWDTVLQSDSVGSQTNRPSILAPKYLEASRQGEYHGKTDSFHSYDGGSEDSHNIRDNRNSSGLPFIVLTSGTERDRRMSDPFIEPGQHISDFEPEGTMSWNDIGVKRRRGHRSVACSTSDHATHEGNFLCPYAGVNKHRRSQSDTSGGSFMRSGRLLSLAEPVPSIGWYPRYDESAYSDSGSHFRSSASSQWPGPNPSPQSQPSYLPDLDGSPEIPIVVLKQDVTSERTMMASRLRRREEAKYRCPVVGCGSTFTRRINLKGHIRAHSDERPFVCSWNGCGKAFARLHDQKRHEQLHAIDRPFQCDGCKRKFFRLDVLNRHLRSKAAEGCRQQFGDNEKNADTKMRVSEPIPALSRTPGLWENMNGVAV